MSSRWISTSLRRPATSVSRLMAACAALTSDDLPMPRAPHSSALLAGRPRAKRWVFSTRRSRTRSIPRRSRKVDAVDARNRRQRLAVRAPDEGFRHFEIRLRRGRGRVAFKRLGDAAEKVGLAFEGGQGEIQFASRAEALPQGRTKLQCRAGGGNAYAACGRGPTPGPFRRSSSPGVLPGSRPQSYRFRMVYMLTGADFE